MSYSFTKKAATKEELKTLIEAEYTTIANNQKAHERDKPAAVAACFAFVDMVEDDAAMDIEAVVYGSISANDWSSPTTTITSANLSVSVRKIERKAE